MARPYGRGEQRNRLLRKPLADVEPLGGRQRHVDCPKLLSLFAVDLSPLFLVTHRQ
jgi:hypothetical protein